MNEDIAYTVTWSDSASRIAADSPVNNPLSVKIKRSRAPARWRRQVAVTAGQEIAKADIDAGKLKFAPAANANGNRLCLVHIPGRDDGGTANGGADLDPTPNTVTFNVTPVADAPDARPIDKPLLPVDAKTNITIVLDVSGSMD